MTWRVQLDPDLYEDTSGSALAIGSAVGSATDNRLLYVDGSGNLADSNLSTGTVNIAGFVTVPSIAGTDTLGSGGVVTGIQMIGLDATPLGGKPTMAFAVAHNVASQFSIIDPTTFAQFMLVDKTTSNTATFTFDTKNSNGKLVLGITGMQLGGTGATVTSIDADGTLAADLDTLLPTQKAVKTYVDSLPSTGIQLIDQGVTANNTSTANPGAGDYKQVSPYTFTSGGTLSQGSIRVWTDGGSMAIKFVIYSDNGGSPDFLLAVSDEVVFSNTSEAVVSAPFSGVNQVLLPTGTYHMGVINDSTTYPSTTWHISTDSTTNGVTFNPNTYASGPTNPWGSISQFIGILDLFVTLIPGGTPVLEMLDTEIAYASGGVLIGDSGFTRNSDNVAIGGNTFYDSTAADPNLISLTGRYIQGHFSTYTGGSTQAMTSAGGIISNSISSAHVGLQGALNTGSGAYSSAGLTPLQGSTLIQGSSGTITTISAIATDIGLTGGGINIGTLIGVEIRSPFIDPSYTGTVSTTIGLKLDDMPTGAFGIQAFKGLYVFNEGGDSTSDFRIEGDTDQNLFFTKASTDKIGIGTNSPSSKLSVNGDISSLGYSGAYTAVTSTYAILTSDEVVDCTGTFTVTLPTAASVAGKRFILKNSGTGVITIATTSTQTIDGSTTAVISVRYLSLTVVSNGSNWVII